MNENNEAPRSAKFLRKRKFLLALPVLVLPFAIMLAWTFGIVGEAKAGAPSGPRLQGLNLTLPGAAPPRDSNWNKMRFYEQAEKDSAKLRNLIKSDPFRSADLSSVEGDKELETLRHQGYRYSFDPYPEADRRKEAEDRVFEKLSELDRQLKRVEEPVVQKPVPAESLLPAQSGASVQEKDIDRLEEMMRLMHQEKDPADDPEMQQLSGMLNTILDIQHPERVREKIREESEKNKGKVYQVTDGEDDYISVLEPAPDFRHRLLERERDSIPAAFRTQLESNRFYGLESSGLEAEGQEAIPAMVHEDQSLVSGGVVKLRLKQDVFIAGLRIPEGHFVYATASLSGERLELIVNQVQYENHLLPVSLSVYDLDGMPGIHIPGAITRDVAKRSAAQSMQGLGSLNALNSSVGAQVTGAGLQMAQNLVSRGARLVRVQLKAGYPVLLKDSGK